MTTRQARARFATARKLVHHVITVALLYVSAGGVCVRILSGLCNSIVTTGCKAFIICCAIHCAAFCNQHVTSSGSQQVPEGAVVPVLPEEVFPAPIPAAASAACS